MPLTSRQNAVQSGIAAVMMLIFGWAFASKGISSSAFYNATVAVFYWSLRIGGIGLAIAAALCAANLRVGLLIDAVVSGLCGALMALIAVYWLIDAGGFDLQLFIYLIFGGGFMSAAVSAMRSYRAMESESGRARAYTAPVAEPVHPASIRPAALPKDGEPPPPEGYLAALAKEQDEPPTASFE
jgi:hypothetical protein